MTNQVKSSDQSPILEPWAWFLMGGCFWLPMIIFTILVIWGITLLDTEHSLIMLRGAIFNVIVVAGAVLGTRRAINNIRHQHRSAIEDVSANIGMVMFYWLIVGLLTWNWIDSILDKIWYT